MARDGLAYEFALRKGVVFHNGDPFTAEDVKFSFDRYRGAAAKLLKDHVAAVEIVASSRRRSGSSAFSTPSARGALGHRPHRVSPLLRPLRGREAPQVAEGYLTPPAVRPPTRWGSMSAKRSTTGAMATREAAKSRSQCCT